MPHTFSEFFYSLLSAELVSYTKDHLVQGRAFSQLTDSEATEQ